MIHTPILRIFTCCCAAAVVLAAPAGSSRAQTTRPAGLDALIEQLGADDWKARDAAQAKIIEMGPAAAAAMAELAAKADNPEVRQRADTIARQIALADATRPTRVTLKFRNAPARDVYASLFKQAGAELGESSKDVFDPPAPEAPQAPDAPVPPRLPPLQPVTIDVENVTFWEAAVKLEEQTGITFDGTTGELRLMRRGRPMGGAGQRVSFSGPFMVTTDRGPLVHRLRVFVEPRVRMFSHAMTADVFGGNPNPDGPAAEVDLLLPARRAAAGMRKGRGLIHARGQVFDVLVEPFRAAHRPIGPDGRPERRAAAAAALAGLRDDGLKGNVRAVVLTREDTVEIDDIAKARNAERKVGGRRFVVNAMNPVPGEWHISGVVYHADPQMAGAPDVRFALLDANGVSLQLGGESRGGGRGGWSGFQLEYRQGPDTGPPAKLRITMAAETKEIEIPFEFKR